MVSDKDLQKEFEKLALSISPQTTAFLKSVAAPMLATLGTMGIVGGASYMLSRKDEAAARQAAQDAYHTTMARAPEFRKSPQDYSQRFNELYTISPTIAKNPQLATKLIKDRLHKGFSVDDLHRLSVIEYHSSNTRKPPTSDAVGRAAALGALEHTLQSIQPLVVQKLQGIKAEDPEVSRSALKKQLEEEAINSIVNEQGLSREFAQQALKTNLDDPQAVAALHKGIMQDIQTNPARQAELKALTEYGMGTLERLKAQKAAKEEAMKKKSSVNSVSDECLAVMLADRYVMAKTAGVMDNIGRGASALGGHLAFMAPALALGAGTVLANMALSKMRESELSNKADAAYADIRKNSDIVLANPEISREAFDAIKSFAPDLAAKPNVLRTFLEHAVNTEGRMPIETIKQMAETQQIVSKKSPEGGFAAGLKAPMSLIGLKVPSDLGQSRAGSGVLSKLKKRARS